MVDSYYLCSICGLDMRMLVTGCQCEDNPVQIEERKRD